MIAGQEHDFEPVPGLPGHLPEGERVLWQGAPEARSFARHALATRWIAGYFAVLALWLFASGLYDGLPVGALLFASAIPVLLGALAIALAELFAWGVAKTTLYTITNRRVVMRIGVALSMTFNIPFRQIESAGLRRYGDGSGTIPLRLRDGQRISWMQLWPHARPWRMLRPEPALRAIPNADQVAAILAVELEEAASRMPMNVARTEPKRGAAARPALAG